MSTDDNLVLVDGSSLAFRQFYALMRTGLKTRTGVPTWAVMGFFNALFDLVDRERPNGLAVFFDTSEPTFRHEQYKEYKANRDEMPDDLKVQWPLIKQGVRVLGFPLLELDGFEADDLIGTVARQAADSGTSVQILTGDQDIFQLVADSGAPVEVLMPTRDGLKTFGRQEVFDKLGVWPDQIIDYKGLCGDSSDNIPGVRGIGPKTASKLLSEYKTLDGIYENVEKIKSKSVKAKLIDGKENAYKSQKLATIELHVPIDIDLDQCKLSLPDVSEVGRFFKSLQFRSLVTRLPKALARLGNGDGTRSEKDIAAEIKSLEVDPIELEGFQKSTDSTAGAPEAASKPLLEGKPTPRIIFSEQALEELVTELSKQDVIALSLSTTQETALSSELIGWALAWSDGLKRDEDGQVSKADPDQLDISTAYIPVGHDNAEQLEASLVAEKLKFVLEQAGTGKVAQDSKFEKNILSLMDIELKPIVFDPMLASYVFNPDSKHNLIDQARTLLAYDLGALATITGTGRNKISLNQAPLDQVSVHAADRARVSLALAALWAGRLNDEQGYLLYEMEIPVSRVLAKMEQAGVNLDRDYLTNLSSEMSDEISRLENEIHSLAGESFNINSTQQLQKVLFEDLGLDKKTKTKTGFSTDATVLESLRQAHEIVPKLIEYRHLTKLRSTYVDALPKEVCERDGRLHGEFNQTVAATGRLSSSNPNLQNIPIRTEIGRRIRKAFIPAEETASLLTADYSQIELRVLAHMSGDARLIEAFEQGKDIHAATAAEIFEVPIEEVSDDQRRIGKTLNFALVYQQGAYATGQDLGISTREAQKFIDKYFSRYPRVQELLTGIITEAKQNGYVSTLWGRRRYFRNLNDRNTNVRRADERAACNAPLQGSAADLIKLAMISLEEKLRQAGLAARLVLQVHDELVLDVPDSELEKTREIVREAMELDQPLKVPLRVDFGVGKSWMDAK